MAENGQRNEGISPKFWIGLVIVVLIGVFLGLNRDETNVSFLLFEAQTALWVALTLAGLGSLVAGWPIGRRRD